MVNLVAWGRKGHRWRDIHVVLELRVGWTWTCCNPNDPYLEPWNTATNVWHTFLPQHRFMRTYIWRLYTSFEASGCCLPMCNRLLLSSSDRADHLPWRQLTEERVPSQPQIAAVCQGSRRSHRLWQRPALLRLLGYLPSAQLSWWPPDVLGMEFALRWVISNLNISWETFCEDKPSRM